MKQKRRTKRLLALALLLVLVLGLVWASQMAGISLAKYAPANDNVEIPRLLRIHKGNSKQTETLPGMTRPLSSAILYFLYPVTCPSLNPDVLRPQAYVPGAYLEV